MCMGVVGNGKYRWGDIWDWYIVVSCTRELFTITVTTPFRTSMTHGRSVFAIFVVAHIAHE